MTRILGIDYGEKRIGLALSDPFGWTAQPLTVLVGLRREELLTALEKLVREYEVSTVVFGLPLHMDGREGEAVAKVKKIAQALAERLSEVEIDFMDERLSSVGAERVLIEADLSRSRRKKIIDKQAASFMLQGYLEKKRIQGNP